MSWPAPGGTHGLTILLVAAGVATAFTTARPAQAATAPEARFQPNLEATVRYLQDAQREDGGFAEPGGEPDSDFTAWVALALAAAGINPRDQTTARQHYAAGHSAYSYLVEHAGEATLTTDFERELLVVDASGGSPEDFGGVDLPAEILGRQITQGSEAGAFPHRADSSEAAINDTVFAILALSPIHEPAVEDAVGRAAQWLEREQDCDGSWHTVYPRTVRPCGRERGLLAGEAEGEVDMTGAAIQALNAAGSTDREGQAKAFAFLREAQDANGGFWEQPGEHEPNVASSAWVVQAMWSAGIDPETWATGAALASDEPLGYLASMQQDDGHIRYEASREENGMWMTAYVTPAFTGNPLPIPAPPDEPLPALPPEAPTGATAPTADGSDSGDGGVTGNSGAGMIAGGGGTRAPLFSRPQPRSTGHTPGGARQLGGERRPKDTDRPRRRNPGRSRKQRVPTITGARPVSGKVSHPGTLGARASGARKSPGARESPGAHRSPSAQRSPSAHRSPGAGNGQAPLSGVNASRSGQAGGKEVTGVLIGEPGAGDAGDRLAAGAPGLRSAGAGGDEAGWPTNATATAIALLILAGVLLERRRPAMTL